MSIKSPIVYKVLDFFLKKIQLFLRKKHNAGGELSVYSELYILTKRADLLLKALEITGTPDLRIEIAKESALSNLAIDARELGFDKPSEVISPN